MTRPAGPKDDAPRLLALAAAWAGLFAAADPRGQFPLNDDFQYAECARRWLAGDGLRLPQWALSSTIAHATLGGAMSAPWGATNQALRFWEITLGAVGIGAVYFLARRWRASPNAAFLAALTLAVSPLYAALAGSFHIDVTAAVFTLLGLHAYLIGRERGSAGHLALSSALIAVSGLSRQTGFLCVAGGLAALALDRKLTPALGAAFLLPSGLAAGGFWYWSRFVHGPTWAWESGAYSPKTSLAYYLRPDVWKVVGIRLGKSVQLGALFLAPLAVLRREALTKKNPGRGEGLILAIVTLAALSFWHLAGGLPLIGNTLTHAGLGTGTLIDADDKPSGWWGSPWLWHAAAFVALFSSLILTRAAAEDQREPRGRELRAAALFTLAPYGAMLVMPTLYDRYMLTWLPAAAAAFAFGRRDELRRAWPALAAAGLLGFLTWAGLTDYYAWNRARWDAGMKVVAHGVRPEQIENGFDWDGEFSLTRNLDALRGRKPAKEIGIWEWQTLNRLIFGSSFKLQPKVPGWTLIERAPYRTPLVPGGAEVRIFAAPGVAVDAPPPGMVKHAP